MAIGAGEVRRARSVAWAAGGLSAALLGGIGLLVVLFPAAWAGWFSRDAGVLAHAHSYLRWAGLGFAPFGLGLTLYFAAQGAGNVVAPVTASILRFLFVLVVGHAVAAHVDGPWALFALVGAAMTLYGAATALGVHLTRWGPRAPAAVPAAGLSRPS
jgi:Na+-driven multidrug efflux pump